MLCAYGDFLGVPVKVEVFEEFRGGVRNARPLNWCT